MALGDPYATKDELRSRFTVPDVEDDEVFERAVRSASREITRHCHRQFNKATEASARLARPVDGCLVYVDDFHTTTDLVIATDDDGDGVFETTWSASDFELEPLNGVMDGEPGWPYTTIKAVGSRFFRCSSRSTLQVTAQWGWAEVPDDVKEACLIIAAETAKLKDAPFGVAGFDQFGPIRVRDNPLAERKLRPYVIDPVLVG